MIVTFSPTILANRVSTADLFANLNTNFKGVQDTLSLKYVSTLIVTNTITEINAQFALIDSNFGITTTKLSYGLKGKIFRKIINDNFNLVVNSATFKQYDGYFKFRMPFIGNQVSFILNVPTGKTVYISWGDNNITTVTGNGSQQTKTSNYSGNGTYYGVIYGNLSDVTYFKYLNGDVVVDIDECNKFSGLVDLFIASVSLIGVADNLLISTLKTLTLSNSTGLTGTFNHLNEGLTFFSWVGAANNNLYIDVNYAPSTLVNVNWTGTNKGKFDLDHLPVALKMICWNVLSGGDCKGSFNNLTNFIYFQVNAASAPANTFSGSINGKSVLTDFSFTDAGTNSKITGDLANVAKGVIIYGLGNCSLVTGNIESLGDSRAQNISIYNCPDVIYNGGSLPNYTTLVSFIIYNSWLTAMVDAILIALDAISTPAGAKSIDLRGNQPRSAASNVAVASLTGKGYVVQTTP
jgi:hypothetical protein